jgi:hypothetical protein
MLPQLRLVVVPVLPLFPACGCPGFAAVSGLWQFRFAVVLSFAAVRALFLPRFAVLTVCRCLWLSRVPPLSSASVAFLSVSLGVLFPFRQAVRAAENRIPGLRYEDREFICSCGLQPGRIAGDRCRG